jgi:hypothetical protein
MSQHERNEWAKQLIHMNLEQNELYHHGILGMHWGVRRYQPYPKGEKKGQEIGEAAEKRDRLSGNWKSLKNVRKVYNIPKHPTEQDKKRIAKEVRDDMIEIKNREREFNKALRAESDKKARIKINNTIYGECSLKMEALMRGLVKEGRKRGFGLKYIPSKDIFVIEWDKPNSGET